MGGEAVEALVFSSLFVWLMYVQCNRSMPRPQRKR